MPRPGPRPYECVRRAWHSDRHQPIRGSIIQQIFRVVNESHSSATKKNREWQEKLPIVVLKAEEIMYSKANSEVEYMDLETLWERVNDAINTIIRRDESTETGKLLPPCVEAALNLGCIPIRASRSQRHSNPRAYLSPRTQGHAYGPPRSSDNASNEQSLNSLPLHSGNHFTLARPMITKPFHLVSESKRIVMESNNNAGVSCNYPLSCERCPPNQNQLIPAEGNTSLNLGRVYPLHYGTHFQPEVSHMSFQKPENSPVIVGTPVYTLTTEPAQTSCMRNLVCCKTDGNAPNRINQADFKDNLGKAPEMGCDLSLQLGPSIGFCVSRGKGLAHDTDNVNPSIYHKGSRPSNLSFGCNKEFSLFPDETANDAFEFCTSNWDLAAEEQNVHSANKKRKVLLTDHSGDGQFLWQLEPTSSRFSGRMKWPGL